MDRWSRCRLQFSDLILLSIQVSDLCRFFKVCSAWLKNYESVILLSVWVSDFLGRPLTFGIRGRWSSHRSQSVTCGDSLSRCSPWQINNASVIWLLIQFVDLWRLAAGDFSLTFEIMDGWSHHRSKSLTCDDSPRGISVDFWNYGSVILLSIRFVDLWRLAKGLISLTFGIMNRWSCHRSQLLTCEF